MDSSIMKCPCGMERNKEMALPLARTAPRLGIG
jgi:hypothetical protein